MPKILMNNIVDEASHLSKLIILILSIAVSSCSTDQKSQNLYETGLAQFENLEEGQLLLAIDNFETACSMEYKPACLMLGKIYSDRDNEYYNLQKAKEKFDKACHDFDQECLYLKARAEFNLAEGYVAKHSSILELEKRSYSDEKELEAGDLILNYIRVNNIGIPEEGSDWIAIYDIVKDLYTSACYTENLACEKELELKLNFSLVQDFSRFLYDYQELCNAHPGKSCYNLGVLHRDYTKDKEKAFQFVKKACDANIAIACFELSDGYRKRYQSISLDYDSDLSDMYKMKGLEISKNECESNKNADSCVLFYNKTPEPSSEAQQSYFEKQCKNGHSASCEALTLGATPEQKLIYLDKACEHHGANSCNELGYYHIIISEGLFSEVSYNYFDKACNLSHDLACELLSHLMIGMVFTLKEDEAELIYKETTWFNISNGLKKMESNCKSIAVDECRNLVNIYLDHSSYKSVSIILKESGSESYNYLQQDHGVEPNIGKVLEYSELGCNAYDYNSCRIVLALKSMKQHSNVKSSNAFMTFATYCSVSKIADACYYLGELTTKFPPDVLSKSDQERIIRNAYTYACKERVRDACKKIRK